MGLASSLVSLGDGTLPASFDGLKSHVDVEWVQSALQSSGVATVRKRKLPAEQIVWLVIGMALYRDRPIAEVVNRLNLVLPEPDGTLGVVTNGAISQARGRVSFEAVRELFATTATRWGLESARQNQWRGLSVLGIDGTRLRVPDSRENRETFRLPFSSRRSAGYPQVQIVALMVLRSHLLLDLDFDHCRAGETGLAKNLIESIPGSSVTILDRYFVNYPLLRQIATGGLERHWIVRSRDFLRWKVLRKLGRGDELVEVPFSKESRAADPRLPETFIARAIRVHHKGFRPRLLLTSLLDPVKYPAAEIGKLYCERWEMELGYDEIKTHTLEREEAIRSKSPDRVRQEIWGLAVAYNLVRREMEAVAARLGVPCIRISFRGALMLVRDLFMWAAVASPGSLPKMVERMRLDFQHLILPDRRSHRRYPRHVKIKMSGYNRNDAHSLN